LQVDLSASTDIRPLASETKGADQRTSTAAVDRLPGTASHPSISAFFPCYNDAGTIATMVVMARQILRELTEDYEVIVVDDGSTDHSRSVLAELASLFPDDVRVVLHERNRGYGGALRSGFAAATKEWVFYTDGDAQYNVAELRRLATLIGPQVDVVQGYKTKRHDPWHRIAIGAAYRVVIGAHFQLQIRDVDCDFRLHRRARLHQIELEHDSGVICLELIRKLQDIGSRFTEVGVSHYFRAYGGSQFFNLKRVAQVGLDILALWWRLVARGPARTTTR
jgi:glycosyltransferase involved in cell wall biosynthesis